MGELKISGIVGARKKMLFTLAVAFGAIASTVHAHGTIQFLNSGLNALQYYAVVGSPMALAPIGTVVGVFWGTSPEDLHLQLPTAVITTTPGVFNGGAVYPLTQPGQSVYLKIGAWYNRNGVTPREAPGGFNTPGITDYGESSIVQTAALGLTTGPGAVVWQGATGINPNRAKPFCMCIPEPSVWALGGLGFY